MKKISYFLIAALGMLSTVAGSAVSIVKDNEATAFIVIPDNAFPVTIFAAEEFQYHIKRASGAELKILEEKDNTTGKSALIYIGNCRETKNANINCVEMPRFGFKIKTSDDKLFLAGNDEDGDFDSDNKGSLRISAGSLFAVYEFLEKEMGVRWLWPGELGEFIPQKKDIAAEKLEIESKPRFLQTYFRVTSEQTISGGWNSAAAAEKFYKEQKKWLYRQRFSSPVNLAYGHAFQKYWERFGKSNPEYFNMLPDGSRHPLDGDLTGKRITLCVSSSNLHKQISEDYKRRYNPDGDPLAYMTGNILSAQENDSPGMCTCEHCRSWDIPNAAFSTHKYWGGKNIPKLQDRFPVLGAIDGSGDDDNGATSLSDRYCRFYLAVQKEARKINPDVLILGYAYANYARPPKSVKLNDGIIISYVEWPYFPWSEKETEKLRNSWDSWMATGAKMILRPNTTHSGHNMPIFYGRRMGNEFSHAAANGMIATNFDSLTGQWAAQGPTLYILGRLHVKPEMPVNEVLEEYYSAFGPATMEMREYFEYFERVSDSVTGEQFKKYIEENGGRINFKNWLQIADCIFTKEVIAKGFELLKKAETAASSDKMAIARIEYIEKGLRHAQLTLAVLAAQKKQKNDDGQDFNEAMKKLMEYRASVENDNISDMGYLMYREKYGSKWNHKATQMVK